MFIGRSRLLPRAISLLYRYRDDCLIGKIPYAVAAGRLEQ
jgi:hypothetical protein